MKIHYQQASLATVMKYYTDNFKADIYDFEWFIDTSKNVVIFKLVLNEDDDT